MHRLLRNKKTRQFFNKGEWTADGAEAQDFTDQMTALRVCQELHLHDMEIVLRFYPSGDLDVRINVTL